MSVIMLLFQLLCLLVLFLYVRWYMGKKKIEKMGLMLPFDDYPIVGCLPTLKYYNDQRDYAICEMMNDGFEKIGKDIFAFDLMGRYMVFLRDIDDFTEVLSSPIRPPGFLKNITAAMGFEGSFNLNGDKWHIHRKISVPALKKSTIRDVSWIFEECCGTFFEVIARNNNRFHVTDLVEKFSFDVIGLLAFGTKFNSMEDEHNEILESFNTSFGYFPKFSANPFLKYITKFKKPSDLENAHNILQKQSRHILEEKIKKLERNEVNDRPDLTDILLSKLEKIDTDGIIGEVSLFLIAGSETTSNTLSYLIYALGLNPQIQDILYQEISMDIGDRNITFDDIDQLKYTHNCVHEALRLSATASVIGRRTDKPLKLQGIYLPAGTDIVYSNYHGMRDPRIWGENANDFVPERFDNLTEAQRKSYLPFGAGKRVCIGKTLAQTEMVWLISSIVKRYQIVPDTPTEWPLPLKMTFTMSPRDQIFVHLRERN